MVLWKQSTTMCCHAFFQSYNSRLQQSRCFCGIFIQKIGQKAANNSMENKKKIEEEDEKGSKGRGQANMSKTEMEKLMILQVETNEFISWALRCLKDCEKTFPHTCTSPHSTFHLRSRNRDTLNL